MGEGCARDVRGGCKSVASRLKFCFRSSGRFWLFTGGFLASYFVNPVAGGDGSAQMTFFGRRHRFPLRGSIGAFRAMYYIAIARTLPVLAVRRVQATPRTLWGKSPQGTCPFYGNRHCYPFQRPRIPRPPARNPAPAKNPRSVRKKLRSGGEVPIVFGIFI